MWSTNKSENMLGRSAPHVITSPSVQNNWPIWVRHRGSRDLWKAEQTSVPWARRGARCISRNTCFSEHAHFLETAPTSGGYDATWQV